jgi:hypothetical protein
MRKLLLPIYGIILLGIALVFGIKSYNLAILPNTTSQQSFRGNLYLNFVPEFLGAAFGVLVPLIIIAWVADKRLKKLSQPIMELIAQLRAEERITKEVARRSAICAVNIISEINVKKDKTSVSLKQREEKCDVCALPIEIRKDYRCKYCLLPDHVWKLEKKPVIPCSSSPT